MFRTVTSEAAHSQSELPENAFPNLSWLFIRTEQYKFTVSDLSSRPIPGVQEQTAIGRAKLLRGEMFARIKVGIL